MNVMYLFEFFDISILSSPGEAYQPEGLYFQKLFDYFVDIGYAASANGHNF
ncbi:MAG: hypothetical protein ACTSUE_24695 [Promethearchaeota archaeon]